MFIVGGSNTYPAEIEAHLETYPAIRQALVVGVPHERLGQVGYAFIRRSEDAEPLDEEAVIAPARRSEVVLDGEVIEALGVGGAGHEHQTPTATRPFPAYSYQISIT